MIDPAVNGTLNVLRTCAKVSSVKRVIVTSSTAATLSINPNDVVDETVFTDLSVYLAMKAWYGYSKTLAEETAWRFAKENGIDLVVMNPGNVIGPVLQPTLNYSVEVIVDLINGKNPSNSFYYRFMDVRDVSLAHIKAFEVPSASGRYILADPDVTMKDIQKLLHELFPDLCRVDKDNENEVGEMAYKVCVDKLKSLGIEFTPIKESLKDTVVSLKERCLLI
jgi:nucleoside-diphosphate-sugar epimerase